MDFFLSLSIGCVLEAVYVAQTTSKTHFRQQEVMHPCVFEGLNTRIIMSQEYVLTLPTIYRIYNKYVWRSESAKVIIKTLEYRRDC